MTRYYALAACLAAITTSARAAHVYEFVQEGTGETLAYWELATLPASYEDVTELLFTPAGESIFGLGLEYAGEFDHVAASSAHDDGADGLADDGFHNLFGGWIFDQDDAPVSDLTPNAITSMLSLVYHEDLGRDEIRYIYSTVPGELQEIAVSGDWRAVSVPEPSTLLMLSAVGASGVLRRSRGAAAEGQPAA